MDGEVGRFEFVTYSVCQGDKLAYNTAREVFPPLRCWEWYKTRGFKELALIYGATEHSYTKTRTLLNRVRHQDGATPTMTIRESAEREGHKVLACVDRTTTAILPRAGFTDEGRPVQDSAAYHRDVVCLPSQEVTDAVAACDVSVEERPEIAANPVCYEHPSHTVNISLDDVVVKRQKAERAGHHKAHEGPSGEQGPPVHPASDPRKYVHNTVAHIQHGEHTYTVTGPGVLVVLRILLGYLLNNRLLSSRLQFFVDGQKTLQAAILRAFSWFRNIGLILDWYHLEDKCKRQLSLAMRGRALRNEVLDRLTRFLWYGLVDQAIAYLGSVKHAVMKDPDAVRVLRDYIERNRPYLPCYDARKRLGLRNSSNRGETMNDLLVSQRQKHHGMSWSPGGSSALAALEAITRNGEYQRWFEYGELELKCAA